jgi:hypothetical protein
MLSEAKHLSADRDRPFAEFPLSPFVEFPLSEANGLRVTLCDWSNGQVLFFKLNLAPMNIALCCHLKDGVFWQELPPSGGELTF